MNTGTRTPLDSGKSETPSISIAMSDLQLASSSKDDNKVIHATPKKGKTKPTTTTTTTPNSTDSSNDKPTSQIQLLFPTDENRAVYHVLKTIGFKGPWIRFLMQDQRLDNYKLLTSLKLDDWKSYIVRNEYFTYAELTTAPRLFAILNRLTVSLLL